MLYVLRCTERGKEPHAAKSKQRHDIEACLLAAVPDARLSFEVGRIYVEADRDITDHLAALHGVASFSPCTACDLDGLTAHVLDRARAELSAGRSFCVKVRRGREPGAPKSAGASTSSARAADLGAAILAGVPGSRVDLRAPDVRFWIEIRDRRCLVGTSVIPGLDARRPAGEAPRGGDGARAEIEAPRKIEGEPRFLVDAMLGTLARRLRALGYDTAWRRDTADSLLLREAHAEHRLLLTQDRELSEIGGAAAYFVHAKTADEQTAEVLARFSLAPDPAKLFTRCSLCNALLAPIDKASVEDRVPPRAFAAYDEFWTCAACDKVYWKGSHYDDMLGITTTHFEPR